jgi:thioredoxin-like negative regulator of GroEL
MRLQIPFTEVPTGQLISAGRVARSLAKRTAVEIPAMAAIFGAVADGCDAEELRRATRRGEPVQYVEVHDEDMDPRVASVAIEAAIVAAAQLRNSNRQSDPTAQLWHLLAAGLANERDRRRQQVIALEMSLGPRSFRDA